MMAHEVSQAFRALAVDATGSSPFRAMQVEGPGTILLAVDADGRPHLLAGLESADPVQDHGSAGVRLGVQELVEHGPLVTYADLALLKPHLHDLYCSVVADGIAELRLANGHRPDKALRSVLRRWRDLIDAATATMGERRQAGLFGELWQLREIVRIAGPGVHCWVGPLNGHHDFAGSAGVDLEVKTTRSDGPRVVEIGSLAQLALSNARELYLSVVTVRRTGAAGLSIAGLVDELISLGCADTELLARLAQLGVGQDLLSTMTAQYDVTDHRLYAVTARFPRLTSDMLLGPLDDRIRQVRYQVDLTGDMDGLVPPQNHAAIYAAVGAAA